MGGGEGTALVLLVAWRADVEGFKGVEEQAQERVRCTLYFYILVKLAMLMSCYENYSILPGLFDD